MKKACMDFAVIPPWGTIFWQTAGGGSKLIGLGSVCIGFAYCYVHTVPDIKSKTYNAETSAWIQILLLAWASSRLIC